ncbi:MAG: CYTH domain-containing protein [Clostridia bacterium]|nr:CYTH domain-containing protein [Clostridia bacterium]
MEIERKFLVNRLPNLDGVKFSQIKQGYFSINPEKRVRQRDDKYYVTEKGEGDMVREEHEWEIDKVEAEELFRMSKTYIVEKTRYYLPYGKYTVELDVYKGRYEGLIVAEVEFESEREALDFAPPLWFGNDITKDKSYKNMVLALNKG